MTAAIKNVHPIRWIQMENRRFREFIAEFIGTFFFVVCKNFQNKIFQKFNWFLVVLFVNSICFNFKFIGVSANIQAAMQPNPVSLLTAQFAWGFGLMFGIYLAINVSGLFWIWHPQQNAMESWAVAKNKAFLLRKHASSPGNSVPGLSLLVSPGFNKI